MFDFLAGLHLSFWIIAIIFAVIFGGINEIIMRLYALICFKTTKKDELAPDELEKYTNLGQKLTKIGTALTVLATLIIMLKSCTA